MAQRSFETTPKFYARIAGLLYLIVIAGGLFAEMGVRQALIISKDPTATAANILAHETLFRLGFASGLLILMCAVPLCYILYRLLFRVNKNAALLAVFFNLIAIAIDSVNLMNHFQPLVILKSASYSNAFTMDQLNLLSYFPLRMQSVGYDISLSMFAFFCIFNGYLIAQSKFIPRIIGVLLALAGVCYLINSFIHFIAPQYSLFPLILVPSFIGEAAICLWLIINGVKMKEWNEQLTE